MHEGIQFQKGLYAFLFYNEIPGTIPRVHDIEMEEAG